MSSESRSAAERREEMRDRHEETAGEVLPEHTGLYIGGEFVGAESEETFETIDPATGEVLTTVARGREADINKAVETAWEAYEGTWSGYDAGKRQAVLYEIANLVEAESDELAKIDTLDNGKPLGEARIDASLAADHFRYFAGIVRQNSGETMTDGSRHGQVITEPYGVVGQIIPWNFPLLMAAWKLAPALAAGNCTVLKPAEQTPLSALRPNPIQRPSPHRTDWFPARRCIPVSTLSSR